MNSSLLSIKIKPDWEGFLKCIKKETAPDRVYFIELFIDREIRDAIIDRYDLLRNIKKDDPFFIQKREIAVQRFLGYDYVRCSIEGMDLEFHRINAEDTAELKRSSGRNFINEHKGPITNMEELEKYPWPDPQKASLKNLEWYQENLPDDMCIISRGSSHFAEHLMWLMGYETLCYALYDDRKFVKTVYNRIFDMEIRKTKMLLEFDRLKVIWGSDDMGFKTGTLLSPQDMREFVLPGHKKTSEMSHAASRPYFLHSCGDLKAIMDDLINDVKIDAKHSFEDTNRKRYNY